jgi:hypothetical protein
VRKPSAGAGVEELLTKRKIDRIHRIENRINRIFFSATPPNPVNPEKSC